MRTHLGRRAALLLAGAAAIAACGARAPETAFPTSTSPPTTTAGRPTTTRVATTSLPTPTNATSSPVTAPTGSTPGVVPPPARSTTTLGLPGTLAVISKGPTTEPLVALTFDAGSDAGHTAQILSVLAARHIPATFGITGLWAQANPDLLRQIVAAGHQIVNHTWDHQSFTGASTGGTGQTPSQIAQELSSTDNLLRRFTPYGSAAWFRPPYGDRSAATDSAAAAAGYRYELMWTVDTLGWKGVPTSTVVQRALSAATPGEIVLMHVGAASTDAAALPELITVLQAKGYRFTTASGLGW